MRVVAVAVLACAFCAHAGIEPAQSVVCAIGAAVMAAGWLA